MVQNYRYIPPTPALYLPLTVTGIFGGVVGFLTAQGELKLMFPYFIVGILGFAIFAFLVRQFINNRLLAGFIGAALFFIFGYFAIGFSYAVLLTIVGYIIARMTLWIHSGDYRLNLHPMLRLKKFYGFIFLEAYVGQYLYF